VVSGPGAGKQVVALQELMAAAPALKPQLREAEWIGNRRWNFTFKTGQVLALPEGTDKSAKALMTFARLDGVNRLLGGKVAAFDMRAGDRIYLRVPGRTDAIEHPVPKPAASEATKPQDAIKAKPKSETSKPADKD
jgi:cell division protein FtsQ